jgi:hypothetical protein
MAMAAAPAGTPRARRRIAVSVRDAENRILEGAEIAVRVNGVHFATIFSGGQSQIELNSRGGEVELHATIGSESREIRLGASQAAATFTFENVSYAPRFGKPGGRCPDGSEGQPCVTCIFGDETIRVCG